MAGVERLGGGRRRDKNMGEILRISFLLKLVVYLITSEVSRMY